MLVVAKRSAVGGGQHWLGTHGHPQREVCGGLDGTVPFQAQACFQGAQG